MVNPPADSILHPRQTTDSPPKVPEVQEDRPSVPELSRDHPGAVSTPSPGAGRWLWIILMCSGGASTLALGAFFWLIQLPPTADCHNTATLTSDRAELYCAQVAAASGQLEDILSALDLVGSWSSRHPLYYEAQPLVKKWSRIVLQAAQQQFQDNHLEAAQIGRAHV